MTARESIRRRPEPAHEQICDHGMGNVLGHAVVAEIVQMQIVA
jgi:hypothetical protein